MKFKNLAAGTSLILALSSGGLRAEKLNGPATPSLSGQEGIDKDKSMERVREQWRLIALLDIEWQRVRNSKDSDPAVLTEILSKAIDTLLIEENDILESTDPLSLKLSNSLFELMLSKRFEDRADKVVRALLVVLDANPSQRESVKRYAEARFSPVELQSILPRLNGQAQE